MHRALLLILALSTNIAFAQIYSWRDANGQMHYSDTPPSTTEARKLNAPPPPAEAAPNGGKSIADQEMEFKKRRAAAAEASAKADKEKAAEAERQSNCAQAQSNLKGLESGQILYKTGPDGAPVGLSGAVREDEIARARASVKSWCK